MAGIRSLSKIHETHPFIYGEADVRYEPAEAISKLKGGNSNWRVPVWFPTSYLLISALKMFGEAYGPEFVVDLPPTSPTVSDGRRPIYGDTTKFQEDPHWRDCLLFHEYFHGDNGAGLGASHQTGWTGLVASLIDAWRR